MKKRGLVGLGLCWLFGCSSSPLALAPAGAGAAGADNSGSAGASMGAGAPSSAGGSGVAGSAGDAGAGPPEGRCAASRAAALGANDRLSAGQVMVLSRVDGVTRLYVDASAGGMADAPKNPWTFISLADASKVEVTDISSVTSTSWDLALKRTQIYTNGGDGGPGAGDAALLDKDFDDVTPADASDAAFSKEMFFDAGCTPNVQLMTGALYTTFIDWYAYDPANHVVAPARGTYLVHGGTGQLYKVAVESYYATVSGGTSSVGGAYLLKFEAL